LDYREQPRVRIAPPAKVSAELSALRNEFFDPDGYLKTNQMEHVAQALARLRAYSAEIGHGSEAKRPPLRSKAAGGRSEATLEIFFIA
jgi:hypothetical protein